MLNADGIERGLYDGAPMTPERRVEHALAWIAEDYPRQVAAAREPVRARGGVRLAAHPGAGTCSCWRPSRAWR